MSEKWIVIQQRAKSFADARDWGQFHSPKNLAMAMAGEIGELIEHFQWLTEEQSRQLDDQAREAVALEMADVLIYLLRMGDELGIDVLDAAERKIEANELRYPVDKAKGSALKYDKL